MNNIDNVLAERLVSIRISDIKKPFNEQPRIKVQGKSESDQNVAYEKNFPRYLILKVLVIMVVLKDSIKN